MLEVIHFHAARRTKYALEALNLKLQLASLPSALAHQMESFRKHVNKLIKEIIANMGANLKEEALTRAARS